MVSNKKLGTGFEDFFEKLCHKQGIGCLKIWDGARRVGLPTGGVRLIPMKNACDFLVTYQGKTALIDSKTRGTGSTFPHSLINPDQVRMMKPMVLAGNVGGYIVYYRAYGKLVFYSVDVLEGVNPMDGLKLSDGVELGLIEDCDLRKIWNSQTL